ncbi:MAG: hypothetical protein PUC65_06255 [Clostridiales bacterium]|nr:hypothetical protein [Clostridiales bacterium]
MKIQPLNENLIKQQGWDDIYLPGVPEKVHIFRYHSDHNAKNIIVLHTPVIPVKCCYECYEQLGRVHHFNVFALDYVPGEGECSGTTRDFSLKAMTQNIDVAYNYVIRNYSDDTHLLGYTGLGGIFAQYYLGSNPNFRSFSQFACGVYKNTKPIGVPSPFARPALALCRLLVHISPSISMSYKPPKAKGYHADLDNEFYDTITNRVPDFFSLKLNHVIRILECMTNKDSLLKEPISCPTLLFKTLHDRFFPKEYFDAYYNSLSCEKQLVEIDDIHNSYFITPEPFMQRIADWVNTH